MIKSYFPGKTLAFCMWNLSFKGVGEDVGIVVVVAEEKNRIHSVTFATHSQLQPS